MPCIAPGAGIAVSPEMRLATRSFVIVAEDGKDAILHWTTGLPSNGTIFDEGMVSVAGGNGAIPITVGNFAGAGSLAIGSGNTSGYLQLSSSSGASTVGSVTISTGSIL